MKSAWIAKNRAVWPITLMCDMLGVSTSGDFEHRQRSTGHWPSQLSAGKRISNEALLAHMRAIHAETKQEWSCPRTSGHALFAI